MSCLPSQNSDGNHKCIKMESLCLDFVPNLYMMTSVSLSLQRPWELIWESLEDAASFRSVDIGKKNMWMNKHCRDWPGKLPQTSGAMKGASVADLRHKDTWRGLKFGHQKSANLKQNSSTHLQLCIMATKQKITKCFWHDHFDWVNFITHQAEIRSWPGFPLQNHHLAGLPKRATQP